MNNFQIIHGHPLVTLAEVDSTNNYAATLLKSGIPAEGTVIMADFQTAGKGQRGAMWSAEKGLNLTFSIILYPKALPVDSIFTLNEVVSLALFAYLQDEMVPEVKVKWPNDILVDGRKMAGILIENTFRGNGLASSVVGIGINLNQLHFEDFQATSMQLETSRTFDRMNALGKILESLDHYFHRLKKGDYTAIHEEYLSHLFGLNESRPFSTKNESFVGIVRNVTPTGLLEIETKEGLQQFAVREIEWFS